MFRFARPTPAQIAKQIEDAQRLPPFRASLVTMESGSDPGRTPHGYAHDFLRSEIGEGARDFDAAKLAFRRWLHFDLGWVRVANSDASIAAGQIVAVEVESFGLWSLNLSRIVDIIDREDRFGFIYTTTGMHIEEGEERFLLRIDVDTGSV